MSWTTPQRNQMDFWSSSSGEECEVAITPINNRSHIQQKVIAEGCGDFGRLNTALAGIKLKNSSTPRPYDMGQRHKSFLALESSDESESSLLNCTPNFKRRIVHNSSTKINNSDPRDNTNNDSGSEDKEPETKKSSWILDRVRNEYSIDSKTGIDFPHFRIPKSVFEKLYDHQKEGVAWMAGLHGQEIGGLLGDDMGMGKTYQTLAFLGGLMRAKTIRNALIVAPLSVLDSWRKEADNVIKLCVPVVNIDIISSDIARRSRARYLNDALRCDSRHPHLIITTYGLIGSSYSDFIDDDFEWDYVVLDEAHKIKNPSAQISKNIRHVANGDDTRRMILTGTPIMNNLKELWALFDFVTSGRLLGPAQRFTTMFQRPIEDARSKDAADFQIEAGKKANIELQEILKPFMLQRLKVDYLADILPTKSDYAIWTHLSTKQRNMYAEYVDAKDGAVAHVLSGNIPSPLEAVTWLKKLCGHPILVEGNDQNIHARDPLELKRDSAKLQVLDGLVESLRQKGHRILIFSQSTKMLDIIERVLCRVGGMLRIDGSTKGKDRQRFVDDFNDIDRKIQVMLLSTKAAGIGLTLTGADRAIIYDPSWNPAEDSQAVDRCYRIGQDKKVTVFRFIASGTVEEKMYEKQVHKDGIRRAVVTSMGSTAARYFDKHDLSKLFRLNAVGQCDFLDRLRQKGLDSGNNVRRPFHPGVVGISSHDILYSEETIDLLMETDENARPSDSQDNPFSSPTRTAPSILLATSNDNQGKGPKNFVLGKSKRVPPGYSRQPKLTQKKEGEQISNEIGAIEARQRTPATSIEHIFSKADDMSSEGKKAQALDILMDALQVKYQNIDKQQKMRLHNKVASLAYELQWL